MDANTIKLPSSVLETEDYSSPMEEGEDRDKITPEVGDPVTFTVKGTVQSISGGKCAVHIAFIDGKRLEDAPDEETDMRSKAKAADQGDES